ncbi:MAG: biotin transporter BioY [Anaerolineae bacterium]
MIDARRRILPLFQATLWPLGGAFFITLAAQVRMRLPFGPVPVTAQTLAVLLIGAVLGARRGSAAVLLYLAQGLLGLPVFAGSGAGLTALLGPTGGYLLGFVAGAYVTGLLIERGWDRRPATTFAALALGNVVIYAFGLPWLATFVGDATLALGLWPFLPGDLFKLACATLALSAGHHALPIIGKDAL